MPFFQMTQKKLNAIHNYLIECYTCMCSRLLFYMFYCVIVNIFCILHIDYNVRCVRQCVKCLSATSLLTKNNNKCSFLWMIMRMRYVIIHGWSIKNVKLKPSHQYNNAYVYIITIIMIWQWSGFAYSLFAYALTQSIVTYIAFLYPSLLFWRRL